MSDALTLSVSGEVLVRLEATAASRGMTREALAEAAVEQFLMERETDPSPMRQRWQNALIQDGLAAAERGEFASKEEVECFLAKRVTDPYLASISHLFDEWNSPEDAAAFDGL